MTLNGNLQTVNPEAWIAVNCGHEIQILDSPDGPGDDPFKTGSIYGFADLNADQGRVTPKGVCNDLKIRVVGLTYTVLRNGVKINEFENRPGMNESTEWHPINVHQDDFRVLRSNGRRVQVRSDQDVVPLPPKRDGAPGRVDIDMPFQDYPGDFVLHCHILNPPRGRGDDGADQRTAVIPPRGRVRRRAKKAAPPRRSSGYAANRLRRRQSDVRERDR
jgi:hypothetical protein